MEPARRAADARQWRGDDGRRLAVGWRFPRPPDQHPESEGAAAIAAGCRRRRDVAPVRVFPSASGWTLEARGPSSNMDALRVDGRRRVCGRASFRGVPAESATATSCITRTACCPSRPFTSSEPRATVRGQSDVISTSAGRKSASTQVRTHVNPPEVAMWIDPNLVGDILPSIASSASRRTCSSSGLVDTKAGLDHPAGRRGGGAGRHGLPVSEEESQLLPARRKAASSPVAG